jgi:hypothetical protein
MANSLKIEVNRLMHGVSAVQQAAKVIAKAGA